MTSTSKKAKVLAALQEGRELSGAQIESMFRVGNASALISDLRLEDGYAIYSNPRTDSKGRVVHKYRIGRPSRAVVAAGYRAMADGIDA